MNRRTTIFLLLALAELCRYFLLVLILPVELAVNPAELMGRYLRFVAAPQLLVPVALFFLWMDGPRYREYLPLVLLGKIVGLVSLIMILPALVYVIQNGPALNLRRIFWLGSICLVADLAIGSILTYLKLSKHHSRRLQASMPDAVAGGASPDVEIETISIPGAD